MRKKKTVAISILGTTMDRRGKQDKRWDKWRPTVSLFQQDQLIIDRLELLSDSHSHSLAHQVAQDISTVSPETHVRHHTVNFHSPWDFESVYSTLLDFSQLYPFDEEQEDYLIHITTGTHVAQICLYLLTEARYLPGKLLQSSPPNKGSQNAGNIQLIDLDLSKYDKIASRFHREHREGTNYLKGGINTQNFAFNKMIEQLEQVSIRSSAPILLTGPTGAGKSQLAQRVYQLRKLKGLLKGNMITVNCATLTGENAMSTLFGHKKGAFTGATTDRKGLLREANGGLLFLDEIGELGLDEQAMLLRAIEEKRFMPLGSDTEVESQFQIIAGTNRDLVEHAQKGTFREDLLARIDLWSYRLPSLKERIEDLPANIDYELSLFTQNSGTLTQFNKPARQAYCTFAESSQATWNANFRDLNGSITRMATLADGGRITLELVNDEIQRLKLRWNITTDEKALQHLESLLGKDITHRIDYYELSSLQCIIEMCLSSDSMAAAGRKLFNVSREKKRSSNDSHRVKQLLSKYDLTFDQIKSLNQSID